jgi:peroxiredoxin
LADFQNHLEELAGLGAAVVALSTDGREETARLADRLGLAFPVLHGVDAADAQARVGVYVDAERGFLHAAAFILRDRRVAHATYSSGPHGRLGAESAIGFIGHARRRDEG